MSLLTLPQYPVQDQIAESGGVYYQYTGSKWKRLDTQIYRSIVENTGYAEYSGNTVVLDTERYNYHKVTVESTGVTIDIPPASPYDTFTVELSTPIDTNRWNIATATYDNKSLSLTAGGDPRSIFLRPDGRKLYVLSVTTVYQYTLRTPWDLSTAYYDNIYFFVSGQDTSSHGIFFSPDGGKMYMCGFTNDRVYQYTLSRPWDVSSASYTSKSIPTGALPTDPASMSFKPDGTQMFVFASVGVYQYTLSRPWDVSSASYTTKTLSTSAQDTNTYAGFIRPDGKKLYTVGISTDRVRQYSLPNEWDLTGAFYDDVSFPVSQDTNPIGLFFKSDGTKMYVSGFTNDYMWQYSIGSYSGISVTWPDNVKWANGVAPTINQSSRYILEFTPTDSYFIGRVVDTFIEV